MLVKLLEAVTLVDFSPLGPTVYGILQSSLVAGGGAVRTTLVRVAAGFAVLVTLVVVVAVGASVVTGGAAWMMGAAVDAVCVALAEALAALLDWCVTLIATIVMMIDNASAPSPMKSGRCRRRSFVG